MTNGEWQTKITNVKRLKELRRSSRHKSNNEVCEGVHEVALMPKKIKEHYPLHVGNTVLHLSKLLLMEFVVFLEKYLREESFRLIYTGS